MEKKNVIYFIAITVVFTFLGVVAGIFMANVLPRHQQAKKIVDVILSKIVSSLSATGVVQSISERNITLYRDGDQIIIAIPDGVPIYKLGGEKETRQKADFLQIKVGDEITVGLKVNDQNYLEGQSVVLFASK